jgi:hypothetical protein
MKLLAHEMGGSPFNSPLFAVFLSPAFAGLRTVRAFTWGLRPRLYAYACSAGFANPYSEFLNTIQNYVTSPF